jgi:uncharacterized protein (TIGR02268 family)
MAALPAVPLLLLTLLEGASVSPAEGLDTGVRRIELKADAPATGYEVRISPGRGTLLLFDAPLQRGTVALADKERFLVATLGEDARVYTLLPSARVQVGERLSLTVSFADGAAPQSATFHLVVHAGLPETQVNVYRHPRTLDSYRQESGEQRQRAELCESRLAQVLKSQGEEGLTGLEAAGLLGDGIASLRMTETLFQDAGNALRVSQAQSFRATGRVAVRLRLESPSDQPWGAEGAELVSEAGVPLKVLKVWREQPIHSGLAWGASVLVEVEVPEGGAQGPHVLKVWGTGGDRSLTLRNVTFP